MPVEVREPLELRRRDALAEGVHRLADAKAACCSFFTFTVTPVASHAAKNATMSLDH